MRSSTELVMDEANRFLLSKEPATLCITGEWGVGKTHLWQTALDKFRKSDDLISTRYSYVSLFGINSLDDLKTSIFENMEWLDRSSKTFSESSAITIKTVAAHGKKLQELAGALPVFGQLFSKAKPLFFSLIYDQIVCIDDLERRSDNLKLKQVLGLISFLREHRRCKVVLLLNTSALLEDKKEFDELFEKVIETNILLAPTAAESALVALPKQDHISALIRSFVETLGICNIRVTKQIERHARRVDEVLEGFDQVVRDQAVHSLTLFCWSKYAPLQAPPLEFFKTASLVRLISYRHSGKPRSKEEENWDSLLSKYNFSGPDDFDLALLQYVDTTLLDIDAIRAHAGELARQRKSEALRGSFQDAWKAFNENFDDNEDFVVSEIMRGMKQTFEIIPLRSLNETVIFLRELGRTAEADELIRFYAECYSDPAYWRPDETFERMVLDSKIGEIAEARKPSEKVEIDFEATVIEAAKTYNETLIQKLASYPVEAYVNLICSCRGEQLRTIVYSALEFRRISNSSEAMRSVVALMEEALRIVGRRSTLNALRVRKYGVNI